MIYLNRLLRIVLPQSPHVNTTTSLEASQGLNMK